MAVIFAVALTTVTVVAASEPSDTVVQAAALAQVEVQKLDGALRHQQLSDDDALEYLYAVGDLERPRPAVPTYPSSVMARVACIEAKESGGANVWNSRGSGAGGVMQYMESTFRRTAGEMGHPEWSRWVPSQARLAAAHDLMRGRRAQWTVSGC